MIWRAVLRYGTGLSQYGAGMKLITVHYDSFIKIVYSTDVSTKPVSNNNALKPDLSLHDPRCKSRKRLLLNPCMLFLAYHHVLLCNVPPYRTELPELHAN